MAQPERESKFTGNNDDEYDYGKEADAEKEASVKESTESRKKVKAKRRLLNKNEF
jgi:hypothetical protein